MPPTTDGSEPATHPPETLEGLRSLSVAITRGQTSIRLGPKAQEALGRILELRGDPALLSITSLAERLDVNPSTLTRLARSLGYPGFGAFQDVLLSASFKAPGTFYARQAQAALSGRNLALRDRIIQLAQENQANIDRFLDQLEPEIFAEAVAAIAGARRVRVHGVRQFHSFASFLAYGLSMIRSDVALLDAHSLGSAEGLAAMAEGDVLVAASCAPYTASVVEACEAAKELGLGIVAITDRASSPLVAHADSAIFVPHGSSFISNSMTAFIACAECLINACAATLGDSAAAALSRRDAMIMRLKIEQ